MASYRDERIKAEYSTNTIRLELAIISHLFEIARKEWGMEGLTNPVKSIRLPSPPSGRDRRLQPGELEKLLECLSEEMGQVVRFALETAMRRGELAGMTWEMVDLKKRTVTFPETKNGQKRIVPLSSVAASILKDRLSTRRIDGEVWNIGLDAISQDFARACHKADISDLHFHDLRNEATSRLFEKGFDTMEVRTTTCHKTLQMLARLYRPWFSGHRNECIRPQFLLIESLSALGTESGTRGVPPSSSRYRGRSSDEGLFRDPPRCRRLSPTEVAP